MDLGREHKGGGHKGGGAVIISLCRASLVAVRVLSIIMCSHIGGEGVGWLPIRDSMHT